MTENKKDIAVIVELFDEIGSDIRKITCKENSSDIELTIRTNEGRKFLVKINDLFCIKCFEIYGIDGEQRSDILLTNFTNYISLQDAHIYLKLAYKLGLEINSKRSPIVIFMLDDCNDYQIKITLSGSVESMDKFSKLWNKIDRDAIKVELNRCLSIGPHEAV